ANQPATLARKQASLRAYYQHRVRMGHLADSPARRLVSPRRRRSLPNVVSVDDVFALLDTPSARTAAGLRDRCALEMLYDAGLRVSELVGVDLTDLIDGATAVRVRGKGGKERVVPLVAKARTALQAWLARRHELGTGPALFMNRRGGRRETRTSTFCGASCSSSVSGRSTCVLTDRSRRRRASEICSSRKASIGVPSAASCWGMKDMPVRPGRVLISRKTTPFGPQITSVR